MKMGEIIIGAVIGIAIGYFVKEKLSKSSISQLEGSNNRLKDEIERKERRIKEVEADKEKLNSDYKELREKLKQQENSTDDISDEFDDVKEKALKLQCENDRLTQELEEYKMAFKVKESEIETLKSKQPNG